MSRPKPVLKKEINGLLGTVHHQKWPSLSVSGMNMDSGRG